MLRKAMLEIIRIIVIAGIYFSLLSMAFYRFTHLVHIATPEWVKVILAILSLVVFFLWYRKRGQYNGWYPVTKRK